MNNYAKIPRLVLPPLLLCINIFQFIYGTNNQNDGIAHQDWGGEKLISIKFPQNASNITLDIPETATIDVTACSESTQDTIRQQYKTTNNVLTSKTWVTYKDGTEKSFDVNGTIEGWYDGEVSECTNQINVWNAISIALGTKITKIGNYAFYDCIGLTSITIPDSVTKIGNYAFYSCSGLTSITIPDGVTSIGSQAFNDCSGLTSITIGNGATSIGSWAFQDCSGLTSITIPDSVTSIGSYAFSGCSGLTSITIPDSVTSIGGYAFSGCSGITSVSLGNGVTSIGSWTFANCSGLTSITIPDGVTSIGSGAFYSCRKLSSITFKGTTAQWNAITKGSDWNKNVPTTCKIICEGDKDAVYTYEIAYNPYPKQVDYNVTNTYVVFGLKNYQNGILLCSTEYHHDIVLDGINNDTTEKVNKGTINVLDGLSYKGNTSDEGVDHPISDTPLNVNWTVTQQGIEEIAVPTGIYHKGKSEERSHNNANQEYCEVWYHIDQEYKYPSGGVVLKSTEKYHNVYTGYNYDTVPSYYSGSFEYHGFTYLYSIEQYEASMPYKIDSSRWRPLSNDSNNIYFIIYLDCSDYVLNLLQQNTINYTLYYRKTDGSNVRAFDISCGNYEIRYRDNTPSWSIECSTVDSVSFRRDVINGKVSRIWFQQ